MKKFALPLMLAFVLTGCSTYQYSARTVGVNRKDIHTKEVAVEVVPDYSRKVTATSEYQATKNDAIKEAEYLCITQNKIDVVVDPIMKIERDPFHLQKKYKATIIGYAGTYKVAKAGVDAVKEYKKEEIEKYKLLTDPKFAQHYYKTDGGNTYYINSEIGTSKHVSSVSSTTDSVVKKGIVKQAKSKKKKNEDGLGIFGGLVQSLGIGRK